MPVLPATVEAWLSYIESLHPKAIEMGLSRVCEVAQRLYLRYPFMVVTVGGTNGKGSTCAMLERIYMAAGYRVGCYTSPHLMHYQERVRFNGVEISDALLCEAFSAVEHARGDVALTYFEMGTLAALWAFEQSPLDVVVLEVGLGGRLDAVNIVDADCAIVTNVDLDHMEFLGDTREAIGREKAGIYRQQQVSICGDQNPPATLLEYAKQLGTSLARFMVDYRVELFDDHALYEDSSGQLTVGALKLVGEYQWQNVANVIYSVRALSDRLPVSTESVLTAISQTEVTGRFQYWNHQPDIILDVAHNPHAARALLSNLKQLRAHGVFIRAVFSMLSDKDITSVVKVLAEVIDSWDVAAIKHPRAASADFLCESIRRAVPLERIQTHPDLKSALQSAYKKAAKNDKIIVFGSFFTVATILDMSHQDLTQG
ncbi:bifunctional tetrahydrofolate synthase/dihydrofolate synthase [Methylophilus aquaticus]|uniref:Dihydrofolate synthase/folylpolyglutamate synthase n=1 Tax=Methylophilus aquaticus TaxID=1971610 RepID=A0ABT9JWY1_9PROT|nr:bifunctional tetrahydrofolate synthase/dihydrofolate synthase [Methylophilus aquaticus]MDP8568631.1 bifunctional tetrahydrofolate synthase/dihydrofolate synthase [Methylophilus aquaticus]